MIIVMRPCNCPAGTGKKIPGVIVDCRCCRNDGKYPERIKPKKFALADVEQAVEDNGGFCIACGEPIGSGVEPDAEKYHCEACGADAVCGVAIIAIMGLISG